MVGAGAALHPQTRVKKRASSRWMSTEMLYARPIIDKCPDDRRRMRRYGGRGATRDRSLRDSAFGIEWGGSFVGQRIFKVDVVELLWEKKGGRGEAGVGRRSVATRDHSPKWLVWVVLCAVLCSTSRKSRCRGTRGDEKRCWEVS
jgi:hypothetical protein